MSTEHIGPRNKGVTGKRIAADSYNRVLYLRNSKIRLEDGPAGTIAKIDHFGGGVDYAGPLPDETVAGLHELAAGERRCRA